MGPSKTKVNGDWARDTSGSRSALIQLTACREVSRGSPLLQDQHRVPCTAPKALHCLAPTSLSGPILSPGPRLSSLATLMSQGDAFTSLYLHTQASCFPTSPRKGECPFYQGAQTQAWCDLTHHSPYSSCPPQGPPGQGPVLLLAVPTTCSSQPRARLTADTPRRVGTDPIYKGPGHSLPHPAPSRVFPAHLQQDPRPRCGTKAPVIWVRPSS